MRNLFTILAMLIAMPVFAIDPITGPTTVCSGSTITLSDATAGGTWSSSNPAVATVGSSTGIVTGTLSASTPGTATITYTTTTETATMDITVNPTPVLTSVLTPLPICDSALFTYTPMSSVAGTTFTWLRPFVPGIGAISVTATGPIMEYLDNSTYVPVNVPYYYTLTAGGCSNTDTVTIKVQPTPILSTHTVDTTCSGALYNYVPMSGSSLVSFAWSRAAVTGISPSTSSSTGNISETLTNATTSPITVIYVYTLTIGGCTNTQNLRVTVSPMPQLTSTLSDSVCSGVSFNYTPMTSTPSTVSTWTRSTVAGITNAPGSGTGNISETLTNTTSSPVMVTYAYTLVYAGCSTTQNVQIWVNPCINGVKEISKQGVRIYPNPSEGSFSVFVPSETNEEVVLILINATGQTVREIRSRANSQQTISFDVPPGLYLLKANTSTAVYENKVLVR